MLVTTYALWAFTMHQASSNEWNVVSIIPFVMALLRYSVDVDSGAAGEPEEIVLHDRMLMALGGIWAVSLMASVYPIGCQASARSVALLASAALRCRWGLFLFGIRWD